MRRRKLTVVHLDDLGPKHFIDLLGWVLIDEVPHLGVGLLRTAGVFERVRALHRQLFKKHGLVDRDAADLLQVLLLQGLVGSEL